MSSDQGFIPMQVSALAVDPLTNVPVVILADRVGGTTLPIGIGLGEAPAIAAELDGIELERPMTHQLMAGLLEAAGARVVRIELRDSVTAKVSAAIVIERDGPGGFVTERPARASDALALALRCAAPIWVAVAVLDRSAREAPSWGAPDSPLDEDMFDSFEEPSDPALLERLGDEAFGKWKM